MTKIIAVIVDKIPESCFMCPLILGSTDPMQIGACAITLKLILPRGMRPDDCPLVYYGKFEGEL